MKLYYGYLRDGWLYNTFCGGRDMIGPASSTDNAIVRFDGTGGNTVQNTSQITIDDNGIITMTVSTEKALQITSDFGTGASDNLLLLSTTNTAWDRPMLRINDVSTAGGAANIRIDSPNPDIEMICTAAGVVSPIGKFEMDVNSDGTKFRINSRNAADNSFEPCVTFARYATGGGVGIGTQFDTVNASLEIVPNGSQPMFMLSTAVGGNSGNLFKVDSAGNVVINELGVSTISVRIEGDTDANLFFTDAVNDRVGIGLNSGLLQKLHVKGRAQFGLASNTSGTIDLANSGAAGLTRLSPGAPGSDVTITFPAVTGTAALINSTGLGAMTVDGITFVDTGNIVTNATTGTKICTATSQKLSFWNKTPIVQPTTGITGATFVANSGTAVNDASTFGGYTLAKIAAALINAGLLA